MGHTLCRRALIPWDAFSNSPPPLLLPDLSAPNTALSARPTLEDRPFCLLTGNSIASSGPCLHFDFTLRAGLVKAADGAGVGASRCVELGAVRRADTSDSPPLIIHGARGIIRAGRDPTTTIEKGRISGPSSTRPANECPSPDLYHCFTLSGV